MRNCFLFMNKESGYIRWNKSIPAEDAVIFGEVTNFLDYYTNLVDEAEANFFVLLY